MFTATEKETPKEAILYTPKFILSKSFLAMKL